MDLLVRDDLRRLMMSEGKKSHISLFMHTHRAVRYNQEDHIRFKNLLRRAEELLIESGNRRPEAEKLLRPVQGFLRDSMFWQFLSDGLAVFITDKMVNYYRLPLHFDDQVIVSDRFHVRPLLPLLMAEGKFYVLALSQKMVRIFLGSHYAISEVDIKNIPKNLGELTKYQTFPEESVRFTPVTRGQFRARAGVYYEQLKGASYNKIEISQYCHQIDRGLRKFLGSEKAFLVLAGVEYLIPIYREANTYPHLVPGAIKGNPERMNVQELHGKAWEIVKPYFLQSKKEMFARYLQFSGEGSRRASRDIKDILNAAYSGRVEALFIPTGAHKWGRYDPRVPETVIHEKEEQGDDDLLDLASIYTVMHDGSVYMIEQGKIPVDAGAAAVYRY